MKTKTLGVRAVHLLVLDPGDDVMKSLTDFAKKNALEGASFSAIGAFETAAIAWWNRHALEYEHIEVAEQVEVLALSGSIARAGDDVKIHAHTVLGRRYGAAIGGHLLSARVFPTLEVFVSDHGTRLERHQDPTTKLWLLNLK